MPIRLILLVALVLAGCSESASDLKSARAERTAQRGKKVEEVLGRTPDSRSYRIGNGELRVIEVPTKDGSNFLNMQQCFLWRDAEYKTATLSCGPQPDILPTN